MCASALLRQLLTDLQLPLSSTSAVSLEGLCDLHTGDVSGANLGVSLQLLPQGTSRAF